MTTNYQDEFYRLVSKAQSKYPKLKIGHKDQSILMRIIGVFLYYTTPSFMSDVTTTIGNTIYFPSAEWVVRDWERACTVFHHEYVHVADSNRVGSLLFKLQYTFPQNLSLLALLAVLSHFWAPAIWFLVFLIALIPWPAPWRLKYEARAYVASIATDKWTGGDQTADLDVFASWLSSSMYYWPSWSKEHAAQVIKNYVLQAVGDNNPPFTDLGDPS